MLRASNGVFRLGALCILAVLFRTAPCADSPLRARVCVSRQEMQGICGAATAKLVFVNGTTLYYVDFSQDTPSIVPFMEIQGGIAPVISPEGTQVAYAVSAGNLEFNTETSAAWVCTLSASGVPFKVAEPACVPRFDKNSATATLIYSTCLKKPTGKYLWDGCGSTMCRTVENSIGPERTLWGGGSYNGGASWDDRYLSTAETSPGAFVLDLNNPSGGPDTLHKFLVKNNLTGKDTSIIVQVCNLSSSPSKLFPRTVMYLDWSSSAFTNANCATPEGLGTWGLHSRIFLASVPGAVLRYYDIPQKGIVTVIEAKGIGEPIEKEWDFPEWSNHPYFAAVSVLVSRLWLGTSWAETYSHEQIYCINLKDSTYYKIIETTDSSQTSLTNMQWPWLWIDMPADFQEDSTWLRASTAVMRSFSAKSTQGCVRFDGNIVISEKAITGIYVYSLRGETISSIRLSPCQEYCLKSMPPKTACGNVYCLRVKTIDGSSAYFRYIAKLK